MPFIKSTNYSDREKKNKIPQRPFYVYYFINYVTTLQIVKWENCFLNQLKILLVTLNRQFEIFKFSK